MDELHHDIRAAFSRGQAGLGDVADIQTRLLQKALPPRVASPNRLLQVAGVAATLSLASVFALAVIIMHGQAGKKPQTQPKSIEELFSAGPAAAVSAGSDHAFVWLTGAIVSSPQGSPNGSQQVIGVRVRVLDWTGKLRYQFDLPTPALQVPNQIQSISADGTRALLDDGTVLDQTGAVVARIPALRVIGEPATSTRWMSDGRSICAAASNQPLPPSVSPPPKGQPNPSPTATPPYARPGADHSLNLKVFGLDGTVRTVATVGNGLLEVPSGAFPDSTSVLSCNPVTDLAVVARYHDADNSAGSQSSTNMTVSLWAIKLSTGEVLFRSPETRMALGRAFFFGSQNGKLAVEFLWNSKVWGAETDVVLQMPSGRKVPTLDDEPIPDTAGLSADGTRILRRVVDQAHSHTDLKLIDASNGHVVRKLTIPGIVGAAAVAQPGGSSFMAQVEGYLALIDGNGGITLLHPDVMLSGPDSVALTWSGVQG